MGESSENDGDCSNFELAVYSRRQKSDTFPGVTNVFQLVAGLIVPALACHLRYPLQLSSSSSKNFKATLIVFQEDCRAAVTLAVVHHSVAFSDVRHRAIVGTVPSSALFGTEAETVKLLG